MNTEQKQFTEAYIVTVDMGYGHQRAVFPLKDIAACPVGWDHGRGRIITANNYAGIPKKDRSMWEGSRKLYETISRFKKVPLIGQKVFDIMDYFQRIEPFYPRRDLSNPSLQVKQIYSMIKRGWGKDLIETLNKKPLPYITSFFATAFFAEEHGYKGEIYCLCTDTDISRAWVPLDPSTSRINYFAPTKRVRERLKEYGVSPERIFVTGFPLPKENIGPVDTANILKEHLGCRISNLDPNGLYQEKYKATLLEYLGSPFCDLKAKHPLTITFAVGGAGAQRDLGITILDSLHEHIDNGTVRLNLVAGSRNDVYRYYADELKQLNLQHQHGGTLNIVYHEDKLEYFKLFNETLLTTDILWTKPSELSFYAGLGIPIIMAPTIGSQEDFNKAWLHSIGAGFEQENPEYTHEWLFDWLESGWLAEAAMEGFMDAPRNGTYLIEDIALRGATLEMEDVHLL